MIYDEVKNAPLNVLVDYLANVVALCNCSCKPMIGENYGQDENIARECEENGEYDKCELRLAYERVMEAVQKQMPMKYHRTRTIEQVIGGARETVCPTCLGVTVTCKNQFPKHCAWCGQALKDGEDE